MFFCISPAWYPALLRACATNLVTFHPAILPVVGSQGNAIMGVADSPCPILPACFLVEFARRLHNNAR